MICPLKPQQFDSHEECYPDATCDMGNCAWWEEHFGKCCIAVDAYLKGVADHRLEVKESMRDKY